MRGVGGSLETAGVKQSFWPLLGLRPKVTRAGARNDHKYKNKRRGTLAPPYGIVRSCGAGGECTLYKSFFVGYTILKPQNDRERNCL